MKPLAFFLVFAVVLTPSLMLAQAESDPGYHVFTATPTSFTNYYVFLDASKLQMRRNQADTVANYYASAEDRRVFGPSDIFNAPPDYPASIAVPAGDRVAYPAIGNPALVSLSRNRAFKLVVRETLSSFLSSVALRHIRSGIVYNVPSGSISFPANCTGSEWECAPTVTLPSDALLAVGLYDLEVFLSDGLTITIPHAVDIFLDYRSSYKFVVLSDIHIGRPILTDIAFMGFTDPPGSKDYHVADLLSIFDQLAETEMPDFVVITGDFVNGCAPVDPGNACYADQYRAFKWALLQSKFPVFITPGNHDQGWPAAPAWRHIEAFRNWINPAFDSGNEAPTDLDDFSFDYSNDHFVIVDSGYGANTLAGLDENQLWWMDADAQRAGRKRTFFFSHAPVVTDSVGSGIYREMSHESPNDYHFARWIFGTDTASSRTHNPPMAAFIAGHTHRAEAYEISGFKGLRLWDDDRIRYRKTDKTGTYDTSQPSFRGPVLVTASSTFDGMTINAHPFISITSPVEGAQIIAGTPVSVTGLVGFGRGSVQLSSDGGFTWVDATVNHDATWNGTITLKPGQSTISAKATQAGVDGLNNVAVVHLSTAGVFEGFEDPIIADWSITGGNVYSATQDTLHATEANYAAKLSVAGPYDSQNSWIRVSRSVDLTNAQSLIMDIYHIPCVGAEYAGFFQVLIDDTVVFNSKPLNDGASACKEVEYLNQPIDVSTFSGAHTLTLFLHGGGTSWESSAWIDNIRMAAGTGGVFFSDNFNDNDISDWSQSPGGNADVVADNGRMRLRVYQCSSVAASKVIGYHSGNLVIDFDWQTQADGWYEMPAWKVLVDGVSILQEGLPIVEYGGRSGHLTKEVTVNGNVQMVFYIDPSSWCWNFDHSNTYLWIDNLEVK